MENIKRKKLETKKTGNTKSMFIAHDETNKQKTVRTTVRKRNEEKKVTAEETRTTKEKGKRMKMKGITVNTKPGLGRVEKSSLIRIHQVRQEAHGLSFSCRKTITPHIFLKKITPHISRFVFGFQVV